jgi:uncharacterized protein (DUF4415 family)
MYAYIATLTRAYTAQQEQGRKEIAQSFDKRLEEELKDKAKAAETAEHFKRFLVRLGDRQLIKELEGSGMLYNTRLAKVMAQFHKDHLSEPPYIAGSGGKKTTNKGGMPVSKEFEEAYPRR